jgi:hypothetical protein
MSPFVISNLIGSLVALIGNEEWEKPGCGRFKTRRVIRHSWG